MPKIDPETVQRILDAADIVEVVSDFVKLRRSGAGYKGLCPFHNERTPSFSVNRARNICKCFSCGKGGSPVNFIMEHEQLSYQEALRYLARKYNIEIVERDLTDSERQAASAREAMLAVNAFALKHFESNLVDTPEGRSVAMSYLRKRGITDAMIELFHLGYSVEAPTDLLDAARTAGFSDERLVDTGLVIKRESDGRMYDRYRGRIIFPIHSLSGRVVGFGGRTMRADNPAKYVNSPESDIYHKKNELYGFYQARRAIGQRDKCIMVEGYFDVISMHQAGVGNVVASSGTSLTEEQIRAVHRFTENITLIYDADAAGIHASLRGINLLLAEKMNVKVLALPPGDDPDSFARTHTAAEVEDYLARNEQDIISFMVSKLMDGVPANDPTAKAKVINEVLRTVAYVDEPVMRQEYISQCSRLMGVAEEVLIRQLNIFITKRYEEADKEEARRRARATLTDTPASAATDTPQEAPAAEAETPTEEALLLTLDADKLRPYEEMLVRYVVRYGLLYNFDIAQADGSIEAATVFDIIDSELRLDNCTLSYPPYAAIMEAFGTIRHDLWPQARQQRLAAIDEECRAMLESKREALRRSGASMEEMNAADRQASEQVEAYRRQAIDEFDISFGQSRLADNPDDNVRRIASELLVDKYTLSKIYTRHGHVESEQEQLHTLVPRAVYELRNAIVASEIDRLGKLLAQADPNDSSAIGNILADLAACKDFQKKLGKVLGERIILPRR